MFQFSLMTFLNPQRLSLKASGFTNLLISLVLLPALVLGSGCSKQARVNRYLARADKDFRAERFDRAEIGYLNALRLSPQNPVALGRLGIIYQVDGRSPAFGLLRQALALDPENSDARLSMGLLLAGAHQLKPARDAALRVLQRDPHNEDALFLLCDSITNPQEMEQSLQFIEHFRQSDPKYAGYQVALGALYFRQQQFDKAEAELEQVATLEPKSAGAQMVLGNLFLAKGDLPKADAALKKSADLSSWRSPRRIGYADFKLKTGAAADAKQIAEEITQKVPDYLPASVFLAQVAGAQGRFDDCDTLLQKTLDQDPPNYSALMLKANLLIGRGDATNAVAHLERVSTVFYKTNSEVLGQLAVAYLMNLDLAKARSTLSKVLAFDPESADATLLLAELDIRQGKSSSAIPAITHVIDRQPTLARAYLLLADAYATQKKSDEAIAVYRRMVPLFPDNAQLYLLLGIQLAQQHHTAEARQSFEKSLQLAPTSISPFEQLVNLDLAEKNYSAATERVKQRLEKTPRSANPWLLLAKIHMAQAQFDQGETALLQAIQLEPQLRNPYLLLANLYRASNKQAEALQKLNALLIRNPNDGPALLQVALLQTGLTNYPAARDAYEQLLAISPNSNPALNNLACLYSEHLGQLDRATELAGKARRFYPGDPFSADTLGWILYQRGDYVRSLGSLQESARLLPAEPEVQFHLGMAHYMMGNEEPARLFLSRFLQATNDFPGKDLASNALAVLAVDPKTVDSRILADLEGKARANSTDPVLLSKLGQIEEVRGNFKQAGFYYDRALQQNPQNSHVMLQCAQVSGNHLGNLEKGFELASEAHKIAGDDAYISYTLGHFAFLRHDPKWALSLINEASTRLPSDPYLQYDLALCQYTIGDVESAVAVMRKSLAIDRSSARASDAKSFLSLVEASASLEKARDASPQARQVLESDPNSIPALMVLAMASEEKLDYASAKEQYGRILAMADSFAPAHKNLAILMADHFADTSNQEALQHAKIARERFPEDADVARVLGIVTYRVAKDPLDYSRSIQLLQESSRKRVDDPSVFYFLGLAQYAAKQFTESRHALDRALALNLDTRCKENALQILATLK